MLIDDIKFRKIVDFKSISLLKMDSFTGIFQEFTVQILLWKIEFWMVSTIQIFLKQISFLSFVKPREVFVKKTFFFSIFISTNMSDLMGCVRTCCTQRTGYAPASSNLLEKHVLKSGSHFPKKSFLFASMIALQKWWKKLLISS